MSKWDVSPPPSPRVIWGDVECGSYEADLPLWEELVAKTGGPVLELGCGTGRVVFHLARVTGELIIGLERDDDSVGAVWDRARGTNGDAEYGDVRAFDLMVPFKLVLAPMQLIQLLPERADRVCCLACVAEHLEPDGCAAFAIVEDVPTLPAGEVAPPIPDVREVDGHVYSSLPLPPEVRDGEIVLRRLRLGPTARFAAGTTAIAAYVWILGWPAPAARAALMLAVDGVGRLRQRAVAPRGAIGLAVLVLLLLDPWALRSVGAWLSVAAIAAVIWAGRALDGRPAPVRALASGAVATLLTAPITAYAFGTVAPVGVVANLVAIPLGAVAVPGLFVALLASWVVRPVAELFAAGAGLVLALLDLTARVAAAMPGGHVVMAEGWGSASIWGAAAATAPARRSPR